MRANRRETKFLSSLVVLLTVAAVPAGADEPPDGWSDKAEFSYVQVSGNSSASTFGLKNKLTWKGGPSLFTLAASGVRADSEIREPIAVGTPGAFVIDDQTRTELTAENYLVRAQYDRKVTKRLFWYAGGTWDRNEFAGIANRYLAFGGVGNTWIERDDLKFKTAYSLTYTKQDDVVEPPGFDDSFAGARFSWEYEHKFTESTTYANTLDLDLSVEETDDWRADMVNSVSVSINKKVALKASLEWMYENSPAFESVPLFDVADPATRVRIGDVLRELDELDTVFTTSLVVTF